MRKEQGLIELTKNYKQRLTVSALSGFLIDDLKNGHCSIFGKTKDEEPVLLARLSVIPETLYYEKFDKRIEFDVAGKIISSQFAPLTYRVEGDKYAFHGRCSTLPNVCGVDLYLSQSYTEKVGDIAQQKFAISVKKLIKERTRIKVK